MTTISAPAGLSRLLPWFRHSLLRSSVCACLLGFCATSQANEHVFPVTPKSLDGWLLLGAERSALIQDEFLSLPPGAQLARGFGTAEISVQLTSRPVFTANPADWPVLEIGPVALVFLRDGDVGTVVLAMGERGPVTLPFFFPLDADTRSTEPVVLQVVHRGAKVVVSAQGITRQVIVGDSGAGPLEVIVSAGAGQSWLLDEMTVAVPAPRPPTIMEDKGTTDESPPRPPFAVGSGFSTVGGVAKDEAGGTSPPAAGPETSGQLDPAAEITMEIATPPSVRRGRAEAARTTTARALNQ